MSGRICGFPMALLSATMLWLGCLGGHASQAQTMINRGFHGEGHDALHHWYLTLKDWQGRPCCDMQDCRPSQSRYRGTDLEVLVDGEWFKVPPHKVLPQSSPDLRTHVCSPGAASNYPRGHIFCVVLGPGV